MLTDVRVAIAFLTRIPIKHSEQVVMHRAARWFPLVGVIIGLVSGSTFYFLTHFLPALPSAVIALLVSTLICGGFHQDGLADVADGVVGGWSPEQRLEILKDSRHGTYGVLALILQYALQVSMLSSMRPIWGFVALVIANSLGRVVPVIMMSGKAAPGGAGMGASYSREITFFDTLIAGTVSAFPLFFGLQIYSLLLLAILLLVNVIFYKYVERKIGGVVGDVLGASEQISETVILFFILLLSFHGVKVSW